MSAQNPANNAKTARRADVEESTRAAPVDTPIPAVPGSVAAPAATSAPVVVDRGHPPTVPPSITDLIHNPKAASPATYNPPPKTVAPPPKPLLNSAVPKQIQQPRGQNH